MHQYWPAAHIPNTSVEHGCSVDVTGTGRTAAWAEHVTDKAEGRTYAVVFPMLQPTFHS